MALVLNKWEQLIYYNVSPFQLNVGSLSEECIQSLIEQSDNEQPSDNEPLSDEPPRVLFVAPYPICPPSHGGGVFMYHTVRELVQRTELHAIVL